jgi:central glycolytic genes regulator
MLSVIEKVAPDTLQLLKRRYHILKQINKLGPIGRRSLAERLGLTERVLRNEVDVLKNQSLITTSSTGMKITSTGLEVLRKLEHLMGQHVGSQEKETRLANVLNINQCVIVAGDSDKDTSVLDDLAHSAVEVLDFLLPEGKNILAVMGGTTMSQVADAVDEQLGTHRELLFVPARGGLGESVDIQANVIAQKMARKTKGQSRVLHAPEHVRSETYSLLLEEPEIKETLRIVENASLVLYSIGDAFEMAKRRGLNQETLQLLKEKRAVAEAFGEFVDEKGEIVYKLSRIGLQSSQLGRIPNVIAVAGGKHKAQAIEAHVKTAPPHTWLVTDEAAANEILNGGNPLK